LELKAQKASTGNSAFLFFASILSGTTAFAY